MIVVDSNVLAYLHLPGDYTVVAQSLLGRRYPWAAPLLWRSEFRNVLAGCVRRGEMELHEAYRVQSEAEDLMRDCEYEVDSSSVLALVQRSDCSAYDCEYVALALQLGTKLVTMDQRVLRAFPEVAVSAVGE